MGWAVPRLHATSLLGKMIHVTWLGTSILLQHEGVYVTCQQRLCGATRPVCLTGRRSLLCSWQSEVITVSRRSTGERGFVMPRVLPCSAPESAGMCAVRREKGAPACLPAAFAEIGKQLEAHRRNSAELHTKEHPASQLNVVQTHGQRR